MLINKFQNSSAAQFSGNGTSAHETGGESLITFTGNPYADLAAYGIDLHGCTIRYLRTPNPNGNVVTGRFNISGREETAGAADYEELILFLVKKQRERDCYVAECHERKRKRRLTSWLSRHPEFTFHNCNVYFK